MKISATEQHERASRSITATNEELIELRKKLEELASTLEEALVAAEVGTGQSARARRLQEDVDKLRAEIEQREQTIEALSKKLPELKREARHEEAREKGVKDYNSAREMYLEELSHCPNTDELVAVVAPLKLYLERLEKAQKNFLEKGKGLNAFLIQEGITDLEGINNETLRQDRAIDLTRINTLYDQLDRLTDELVGLQGYCLTITTATINQAFKIEDPPKRQVKETCDCGLHYRTFIPTDNVWHLYLNKRHPMDNNAPIEHIGLGVSSDKPAWPCA